MPSPVAAQPEEQARFALWIDRGNHLALAVMAACFAAYVSGLWAPWVPLDRLDTVWNQPVERYLRLTTSPSGWGWLPLAGHADYANLIGIALLASCAVPGLIAAMRVYARRGDRLHVVLCVLQAAVLVLAASGWISGHR